MLVWRKAYFQIFFNAEIADTSYDLILIIKIQVNIGKRIIGAGSNTKIEPAFDYDN